MTNITQIFTPAVLDHFHNPRCVGELSSPSGKGLSGSTKTGVFMQFHLCIEKERITDVRFKTHGCVPAIACGSFVAEWCRGRTVAEARDIKPSFVIQSLGGLPYNRHFCASLAVEALLGAIKNAEATKETLAQTEV